MDRTDAQWAVLKPLLPEEERTPPRKRGRPWKDPRQVRNAVLWILRTGAPWKDLPERYPPHQTCRRRFQRWVRTGAMETLLQALARHLKERGGLDVQECFIDGAFAAAKKGGDGVGKTKRGKGTKLRAAADRAGLPIAVCVTSARPHEATLAEPTLAVCFAPELPKKRIADRAYDSDPLNARLAERGIERIAPHRRNRRKPRTQDGPQTAALQAALEGRAPVCLVGQLPTAGGSLRASSCELLRLRAAWLPHRLAQTLFMR